MSSVCHYVAALTNISTPCRISTKITTVRLSKSVLEVTATTDASVRCHSCACCKSLQNKHSSAASRFCLNSRGDWRRGAVSTCSGCTRGCRYCSFTEPMLIVSRQTDVRRRYTSPSSAASLPSSANCSTPVRTSTVSVQVRRRLAAR